jgi:hypothetical protein
VEVFNSASILFSRGGYAGIDEARWGLNSGKGLGDGWLVTIEEGEGWAIPPEISFVNVWGTFSPPRSLVAAFKSMIERQGELGK